MYFPDASCKLAKIEPKTFTYSLMFPSTQYSQNKTLRLIKKSFPLNIENWKKDLQMKKKIIENEELPEYLNEFLTGRRQKSARFQVNSKVNSRVRLVMSKERIKVVKDSKENKFKPKGLQSLSYDDYRERSQNENAIQCKQRAVRNFLSSHVATKSYHKLEEEHSIEKPNLTLKPKKDLKKQRSPLDHHLETLKEIIKDPLIYSL